MKEDQGRSEVHNEDLNDLYCSPNIVRLTKSRKNEMSGACSAYGGEERRIQGKPEGKETTWGDPGVDGRIILR